jgi:hypothetical protein
MVSGRPTSVNDSISAPAGKLGLFVQPAPPAAWTPCRSRPIAVRGKLALFYRGSSRMQFVATPCRHSTCPPNRSCQNWVCFAQLAPGTADLRIGTVAEIGFVCTTSPRRPAAAGRRQATRCGSIPNPQSAIETPPRCPASGNWVCFVGALPASDALQVLVGTALVLERALAQIGFVWRRSPVRSDAAKRPAAWARAPMSTTTVPAVTRKLGLFVQPSFIRLLTTDYCLIGFVFSRPLPCPIRHNSLSTRHLSLLLPGPKLGLFGAEWWNDRILEWWDIPVLWAVPQPAKLALFVQTGIWAHWFRLPNQRS